MSCYQFWSSWQINNTLRVLFFICLRYLIINCNLLNYCYYISFLVPVFESSIVRDPCQPSPCGPNSVCRNLNGIPSCSCQPNFEGSPPNCRPECTINEDCSSNLACINQKCRDPCPGSCGVNAECQVIKHLSICTCLNGFTGNAFTQCTPVPNKGKFEGYFFSCVLNMDEWICFKYDLVVLTALWQLRLPVMM